jgi:hypothetical protein
MGAIPCASSWQDRTRDSPWAEIEPPLSAGNRPFPSAGEDRAQARSPSAVAALDPCTCLRRCRPKTSQLFTRGPSQSDGARDHIVTQRRPGSSLESPTPVDWFRCFNRRPGDRWVPRQMTEEAHASWPTGRLPRTWAMSLHVTGSLRYRRGSCRRCCWTKQQFSVHFQATKWGVQAHGPFATPTSCGRSTRLARNSTPPCGASTRGREFREVPHPDVG